LPGRGIYDRYIICLAAYFDMSNEKIEWVKRHIRGHIGKG
jgi:hypothetical protein